MSKKMPVLFLSHGSPMNVILDNDYTEALKVLGKSLEVPKAIMIISAHWKTRGTYLTYSNKP
ncbi:4,5-DOPA dioxygenase extradiol, partial [Clostridium perfringens]|nr:4,5-DOPA dioxygenase extradiol [Clostridium perfringens]